MKTPRFPTIALLVSSAPLISAQIAPNGAYLTGPYGPGGTWNLYQTHNQPMTWTQAEAFAESLTDPLGNSGKKGHIICISGAPENMFVYQRLQGDIMWLGLTDNEKWGGKEAGANRAGGWRWVTGEPLTYAYWRCIEPNELDRAGEDAVAMETSCRWADWPMGSQGQTPVAHPFMIEWETNSKVPVPGADAVKRILPEKWPVDLLSVKKSLGGSGPWVAYNQVPTNGMSIAGTIASISSAMARSGDDTAIFRMPRLNYRELWNEVTAGGWTSIDDKAPFSLTPFGCASLHVATVHLDKPATWSIDIHGDDYFAVRFPGVKWKSVTGSGGIDPLDPETIYHESVSGDGHAIGVIDLPAGDTRIEAVRGNRESDTMIQLLAAPGEITLDGGTDQWRFPGYKTAKDLPWPGVDASGWKVLRADRPATAPRLNRLMDGQALFEGEGIATAEGVAKINYIDSDAAGDVIFPNPIEFPGDKPGNQDQFAVRATGNLVIPRDGVYNIGIHADDRCALRIRGEKWNRLIRDSSYVGKVEGDTIYGEAPIPFGTDTQLFAEIELKKGTYEMDVFYLNVVGPSVLSVFGAPAGHAPRLLEKDGGKIEPDIDGLPLVEPKRN